METIKPQINSKRTQDKVPVNAPSQDGCTQGLGTLASFNRWEGKERNFVSRANGKSLLTGIEVDYSCCDVQF